MQFINGIWGKLFNNNYKDRNVFLEWFIGLTIPSALSLMTSTTLHYHLIRLLPRQEQLSSRLKILFKTSQTKTFVKVWRYFATYNRTEEDLSVSNWHITVCKICPPLNYLQKCHPQILIKHNCVNKLICLLLLIIFFQHTEG